MKKKLNKKDFIFEKLQDQTLFKQPGQINGIDFLISNLNNCKVYLCDHIAQIFVDDCKNCKIYIGPVNGSCFVRDCENIEISVAAEQFRISDSKNITAFIYSATDPALEKSSQVVIGPYNFAYQKSQEHFHAAKIDIQDVSKNHWSQVYDFTPANPKNWEIISGEKFPGDETYTFQDIEDEAINPVQRHTVYGGSLQNQFVIGSVEGKETEEGGMFSFDIKTGAEKAQEIVNKHEEIQQQDLDDYFNQQDQNINENIPSGQPINDDDFFQMDQQNNNIDDGEIRDDLFIQGQAMNIQQLSPKIQKLMEIEQKITEQLRLKEEYEFKKKIEIIDNAKKELNEWRQQRQMQLEARKKRNRENQALFIEQQNNQTIEKQNQNPWAIVADNIDLKTNESQDGKDVTRIKQAILGAKSDYSKRIKQ